MAQQLVTFLFVISLFLCSQCHAEPLPQSDVAGRTVSSVLESDNRLEAIAQLLSSLGLTEDQEQARTFFAPTNEGLEKWQQEEAEVSSVYLNNSAFELHLKEIVLWHMVPASAFTIDEIFDGVRELLENRQGNYTIDQTTEKIDNLARSSIVDADLETAAADGETVLVHVIDNVIVPPYLTLNMVETLLDSEVQSRVFSYSTMASLALFAELDEEINQLYEGGLTLLVPPNRRFNRAQINVPALTTEENRDFTRDFVLAHLLSNGTFTNDRILADHQSQQIEQTLITSALGTSFWISTSFDRLRLQASEVLETDQLARNGIYHVLDKPLFPPFISDFAEITAQTSTWDTSDCYRFFTETMLTSREISLMVNNSLTLFCPTREAFANFNNLIFNRLLEPKWVRHAQEFLFNHISSPALSREQLLNMAPDGNITMLNGETYALKRSGPLPRIRRDQQNQARIQFGDIIGLDGYLHIMDTVLPPTAVMQGLYERLQDDPDFSILQTSIKAVNLEVQINSDLPLTLLAPDNEAFERVSFPALSVGDIIKRHLFEGLQFCDAIANLTELVTVSGDVWEVELRGEPGSGLWGLEGGQNLYVGGAYIYDCDIFAVNGVFHKIDRVIGIEFPTVAPTTSMEPSVSPQPTSNDTFPSMAPSDEAPVAPTIPPPPLVQFQEILTQTVFGISNLTQEELDVWEILANEHANAFIERNLPDSSLRVSDLESVIVFLSILDENDGDMPATNEGRNRGLQPVGDEQSNEESITIEYSHTVQYRSRISSQTIDVAKYILEPFNEPQEQSDFQELLVMGSDTSPSPALFSAITALSDTTPEKALPPPPTSPPTQAPTPSPSPTSAPVPPTSSAKRVPPELYSFVFQLSILALITLNSIP